ncbi:MAG TPA: 2-dehydropantoate 2-reductase [Candidatus Limnocylindrales bacterium]|nr:2-dehydropantoate 2-reductase [Candidatus Limnocylindrales bacterium]
MSSESSKMRVAVMGGGAVGSYFGGMLARAGVDVTLIARPAHVEAIRRDGLLMDTTRFRERVRIGASTDPAAVAGAGVVLFCVKTLDTESAARTIAPHLSPHAIVLSLQNGVDNIDKIRAASGIDALPAVVYVAVAMPKPGAIKHSSRGELAIGEWSARRGASREPSDRCRAIADLFTGAGVPCRLSEDIEVDLWGKLVMNCAGNAVSAIAQATYGEVVREPHTREVVARLIEETVAVARASGVRLPEKDFVQTGLSFFDTLLTAASSTAQDIARGKPTEIDSLNGLVVERGRELGIPTPVNFTVHALVKLLEAKNEELRSKQAAARD